MIVSQGDTPIRDFKQLQAIIEKYKGAEKLDFGVMHNQEKKNPTGSVTFDNFI